MDCRQGDRERPPGGQTETAGVAAYPWLGDLFVACSRPVHPRFDHIFALPVGVLPAQAPTGAARRKSERAILGRTATLLRTDHPENPRTEGEQAMYRSARHERIIATSAP